MVLRLLLVLAVIGCNPAAQSRGPLDLANEVVAPGSMRLSYSAGALQFAELRLPTTKPPHPVAIIVHGGCWLAKLGNMDSRAVALDNMRPLAVALTDAGIATWNVEYRRLGNEGGGWPGTFQDIGQAADFLRVIAAEHQLDLTRVIAIGHSAGGHLASWLGVRHKVSKGSEVYAANALRLSGVVNLDGPADLKATIPLQQPICGVPVITQLMGGSPEERPDRYRDGSPVELLPAGLPQEVYAGRMFAKLAGPYDATAKRAGDDVRTTVLEDAGHFVFIDPQSAVWPQVLQSVRRLLRMTQ